MGFRIRMGVPQMLQRWKELSKKNKEGTLSTKERELYIKWGKALKFLSQDPFYPSLQTHEIETLTKRYGQKVWQSYLENKVSRAMRMYWVYGPNRQEITVVALEPHPEDKKNGAYEKISLSCLPKFDME